MNRTTLALALAFSFATLPAFAADAVVVPTPSREGGVVVKKTTEISSPAAESAASSVRRAARRTSAAAHRASTRVKRDVRHAMRPTTTREVTRTSVATGNGAAPVVITKEKKTTTTP